MRLAIMQPYIFPYIGYFQLIKYVDLFVVYDNIKYTKKGWINRNRYLKNGKDTIFSIPLKKDSDYLDVRNRMVSGNFDRRKLLNQIKEAYRKAPYFEYVFPLFEKIVTNNELNLFKFIHYSIEETCKVLNIATPIIVSSNVAIDHSLQNQDKVLAICCALGADMYINPIGGQELYSINSFASSGIDLKFLKSKPFEYTQFGAQFVPWLSIIDVMMFNSPQFIESSILKEYYIA